MEALNNLDTNADAGASVRLPEEISLNIGETQRNNPEVVIAENREIQKYGYVLRGVAWVMSIHVGITVIEMLRYVSSGVGPDGTSHTPQMSTVIVLTPLVIIFLILFFLTPGFNAKIGIPSPDILQIMSPAYDFVSIMLLMWISIYFGLPVGRNLGLVYLVLDIFCGFNFLYHCYAVGKVLLLRKRQLSESIESELLDVGAISKHENV